MSLFGNPRRETRSPAATKRQVNQLAANILQIKETPRSFAASSPEDPSLTHYASFTVMPGLYVSMGIHKNGSNRAHPHASLSVLEAQEPDYLDNEHLLLYTSHYLWNAAMFGRHYKCTKIYSEYYHAQPTGNVPALQGNIVPLLDGPLTAAARSKDVRILNRMLGIAQLSGERCLELIRLTTEFDPDMADVYPGTVQ